MGVIHIHRSLTWEPKATGGVLILVALPWVPPGASVLSLFFASIYVMALLECELVSFCEALEVGIQMRAPGMGRWLGGADAHHVRTGT